MPAAGAESAGSKAAESRPATPFGERRATPDSPAFHDEHTDVTVKTDALGEPRLLRRPSSTGAIDFPEVRTTP